MGIVQHRSKRKATGGRLKSFRKKRVYELGNKPTLTEVGKLAKRFFRGRGGNVKSRVLRAEVANVIDKEGKAHKSKIKQVIENPANQNYTRRNIINKGAIIETEMGKAIVTSRPGQTGTLNAKLI